MTTRLLAKHLRPRQIGRCSSSDKKTGSVTGNTPAQAAIREKPVLKYLAIEAIAPAPRNPRAHTRAQIKAIAKSIDAFGFNAPILLDRDNHVVAGHGRLEAAKLLGIEAVPTVCLAHLTKAQAKAYMLADNKLTDRSSFNDRELALCLKELQEIALDFEIEATGFEVPEIDFCIQSLNSPETVEDADNVGIPAEAVSMAGDIWNLGDHRLLCGDALDPQSYKSLLETDLVAAVFTDPPYNVRINGHVGGKGRIKPREFAMAVGELNEPQFTNFLLTFLQLSRAHCVSTAVFYMCMDWRHLMEASTAIQRGGGELMNLCVWSKNAGGMGSLYRSAHELVFVFRAQGAKHRNNVQLGRYGRNRTNVWHYPGMASFGPGRAEALAGHPTVKPVALVADAILDVTKPKDIVLDPFCGSGTTILAAERTGRFARGIELDPLYVDLAITRWQKVSGNSALHACGKTFEQMRIERSAQEEGASAAV